MPIYSVQGPDGKTYSIEGPPGATREEVIGAIQARMAQQPRPVAPEPVMAPAAPAAPSTQRSFGEAGTDILAAGLGGLGGLLQFPGQVVGLLPGLRSVGEFAQKPGEALSELSQGLKSEGLKAREALRSKAMSDAEKDGILSEYATAIVSTIKDPALITTFVAEQVPLLLGPLGAVKVTQKIGAKTIETAGTGLTGAAAEQAVKDAVKTVNKRAAAAAYGTGAAMQAADVGDDTYRDAYDRAIKAGLSEGEAATRAIAAARIAGTGAGVTALLAQRLPGAQAIEKRLAGVPGAQGRVASGFGEAIGESLEEGGGQVFKNIGLRQVDPEQALLEGVGGAAGLGALGGGILGTALGKKTVEQEQRFEGQREGETDRQFAARLQREIDAGLRPPAPPPAAPTLPTDQQLFTLAAQPNGYGLLENLKQRILQDQQFPEADRNAAADNIAKIQGKIVEEGEIRKKTPGSVVTEDELKQAGIAQKDPIASIVNKNFLADNQVFDTINQALSGEITDAQRKKYEGLYEGLSQLRQDFYPEGQDAGIPQMVTLPTAPVEEKAPTEEVAAAPAAPKGPTERQQRIEFGKGIGAVQPYPGTLAGRVNLPAQKAAKAGNFKGVIDALRKSKNAVVAEIARRAKDLKTKIAIDDEAVETYQTRSPVMDQFSSDSAKMHLGLLEKMRELAPTVDALPDGAALPEDVLAASTNVFEGGEDRGKSLRIKDAVNADNSMFGPLGLGEGAGFGTKEDFKRTLDAFERLTNELGETKLRMTAQATINAIGAAGVYDAGRDTIFVPEYSAKDEKTLAHEIVHAQTVEAIANPTDEQKPAVQRLEKLYAHVKKVLEERASQDEFFRKPYGIESVQEFVAEGLGNPDFQYTLSRIEYENTTAWDRFTKTIANLLGLKPDNAFTELLQVYSDITTPAKIAPEERVKRIRGPMPPKMPTKAQELPQPKAPVEEGVAEAEKTIKAAERARRTAERQSPSLFTALRGKLTKTEVSDVGANSLRFRPLISKGKGDSISTFVANGDLDPWLPPDKRLGAPNYDEYDNTEFIKEQLRQGNFLTQEANVQIKAAFEGIQQAESLIREYLTPKEVEALINEAQDEQRRIDQAAKRTAAERPPGTAETEDVGDAGLDLGPEFEAQPLGERVVKKSLAAIPEARFKELERRVKQAEQRADEAEKAVEQAEEAKPEVPPEIQKKIEILKQVLRKNLNKFGLKDVELNLERGMTDEGSYDGMLIKLALDAADPLGILRHESVHALKEAGFFTDKQWATLEKMADTKWIDQYLKGQRTVYNGQEMSRYEGYMQEYGGNMAMIREEAIADAFRNFSKKQPAGLMGTLTTRMKNFFKAVKSAFNGQGFESAEDIFGKVEEGALKPTKPAEAVESERKASLRTEAAGFTPERIDNLINEYGYTDGRTYGFAAFVNPKEFVNATTSSKKDARRIYDEAGKLDVEALRSQRQTPFLYVDMKTGRIDEHEGRHRMAAMDVEGITSAPVVIVARENKGKKPAEYQPIGSMLLSGQKFGEEGTGDFISVSDLTPLVYTQEEELKKKFANPERLRFSMRSMPTYDPDIDDRIDKVIPKRPKEGFIDGLINFFSPDTFTLLREEFINRYNEAAELDKRVAAQIKAAGGPEQLADERAESAALMSDQSTAVAAAAMGMHNRKGGIPVYADGVVTVDTSGDNEGIVSIFAPLASTGNPDTFRHYQFWANVNRGKRYMLNPGKTRYVERTLEPGDIERAEKRRLEYLDMGIDFRDIQARWRKYNDGLVKLGRDTGVISSRAARDFMEHGDYFPFYRQLNEEDVAGPKTFSTIASVKPPKAAKGSEAEYADFFETVVRNTQAMVTASMKNVAAQRMTAQALRINEVVRLSDNPQIKQVSADTWDVFDGDYIDTVPGATKAVAESAARAQFGANVNVVESPTNPGQWNVFRPVKIGQVFASNAKDAMEEARTQHLRRPDIYVYKVLENGTPVYYRAYDLKFINAIKAMNMADLPFIGLLAAPANALRTLVTKEPGYMLVNQMRDSLSAYVTSGVKMTPIVDSARQFAASISKETPEMEALFNAGVIGGYEYAHGVKEGAAVFEREVRKKAGIKTTLEQLATPATSLWGALERGTQISDGATRAEVYKRVLAETGNRAEALWQAAEVLNFYRHGRSPIIRVLTAAIPFMNARIQGLDVLYRAGINPMLDKNATDAQRQRMKTFWTRGMTMMALSSMYWMLVHDDEEYKKQEQETRDNYWLIPGMGLKIAIPFEVGVIFKVLPERILQNAFGSDTGKDTLESLKRQLQSTLGFNFIPQAFLPLYETQTNFSFFTQRPIIGQGMEDVAARYQVSPGTSMFAQMLADTLRVETSEDSSEFTKALAKSLDLSPIKVDHVIKGYTGTIGQYAVEVFDAMYNLNADVPKPSKRFEQLPVIKRLALDPDARGQVTGFFDLKNAVDEVVRTSNLLERTAQTEDYTKYLMNNMNVLAQKDYVLALDKSMKEFREMKTMIQYSNMSADVKRDLILDIQRMENQLTTNIQEVRKLAAK